MLELAIAFVAILLLCLASFWANRRFRDHQRLPMQWSLGGKINWTAPRRLALAFTPALGGLAIAATALGVLASGAPRPGQEGLGPPIVMIVGLGFLSVHVFHLRLIDRALR